MLANFNKLSPMVTVVESIKVRVPFTSRLPSTVRSPVILVLPDTARLLPIVTLSGNPTCTEAPSPEPVTSISLAVPVTVAT